MVVEFQRQNTRIANQRSDYVEAKARVFFKYLVSDKRTGAKDRHRLTKECSGGLWSVVKDEARRVHRLPRQMYEMGNSPRLSPQIIGLESSKRNTVFPPMIDVADDSFAEAWNEVDRRLRRVRAVE